MTLTKVLITVKTYPTISKKHSELVCTAGFREDGSWIRIYPIQFRKRPYHEQYKKYQWIEIDLVKNEKDFRPESFRPASHEAKIKVLSDIAADGDAWHDRRKIVLKTIHRNLKALIAESLDTNITTSLAVFKPTKIIDFSWEEVERDWSADKLESLKQINLFENVQDNNRLEIVRKLPYKFSFTFEDETNTRSTLMIEDWEVGQLFWSCFYRANGNEAKACEMVRKKYFEDFAKTKDLHFYLGTTLEFHRRKALNPFVIIGTFHPKHISQGLLF